MKQQNRDEHPSLETDLTLRRRWVPLRGMEGALNAPIPPGERPEAAPPGPSPEEWLEWLIVGGGIHGTYLSHFMMSRLGVPCERIRVLDPHERPLAVWLRNSQNVGMEYLRSAAVHHLDLPSLSLKRSGESARAAAARNGRPRFIAPYGRPLLELFNQHAFETIERNGLGLLRVQGRAVGMDPAEGGYEVRYSSATGRHTLRSRNVLLAIGTDDATCWPEWARALRAAGARVHHVLDADFHRGGLSSWRRAIVYGGGLSGAQIAVALAGQTPGSVTLISGHEMEVHLFDSEPSWQGANFMTAFAAVRDPARRREIITRERHRGSLTPEAHDELERLQRKGDLRVVTTDANRLEASVRDGGVRITAAGDRFEADLVILATGYDTHRPGGVWLDRAIDRMGLPCAPCGYPIVSPSLRWRPGLYVTGPLAELELGPVARNISGAHRTAARLEYSWAQTLRRTTGRAAAMRG